MTHDSWIGKKGYLPTIDQLGIFNVAVASNFIGTKVLIAQWANKYSSLGEDIVNINVNDLASIGATPISVSLILSILSDTSKEIFSEIGYGCNKAASEANLTVSIGEIAILPDILTPYFPNRTFNLASSAIGCITKGKRVLGMKEKEGDIVLGVRSNGIHCNGYALVRKVLLRSFRKEAKYELGDIFEPTGRKIEDELLRPTLSYLDVINKLNEANIEPKGLVNVTSLGTTSLLKIGKLRKVGFLIDNFPETEPIFDEIRKIGKIQMREMFRVFNMGIGFYIIVEKPYVDDVLDLINKSNYESYQVGSVSGHSTGLVLMYMGKKIIF